MYYLCVNSILLAPTLFDIICAAKILLNINEITIIDIYIHVK